MGKLLLGVGVLFMAIGIVAILISTVKWQNDQHSLQHGRFGIVFDAGESGTGMYVYEYKNDTDIEQTFIKRCEEKGISNYNDESFNTLQSSLTNCLHEAEKKIPQDALKKTPVFLQATAGMRKLRLKNETEYNIVWQAVRDVLNDGTFPVKFVGTMSGKNEVINSWMTINQLMGKKESSQLTETGSTSFQIAFEPKSNTSVPANMSATVHLNGRTYNIYVKSYLCLGKEEFRRRYYAKLVKDASYNKIVNDPCSNTNYNFTLSSTYLWEIPCVQGEFAKKFFGESILGKGTAVYIIRGASEYDKCKKRVYEMFNNTCTQQQQQCGINNIFQPEVVGKFFGIGKSAFDAADFLQLPDHFNRTIFDDKLRELCSLTAEQVKQRPGYSKYSLTYCLSNSFSLYILEHVIEKVDMTLTDGYQFVKKIKGKSATWTLGYTIRHKDDFSPAKYTVSKEISDKKYIKFAAIFGSVTFLGLVFMILATLSK